MHHGRERSFSSAFACVMPSASAATSAWNDHFTTSNHRSSPCRTAGVSASVLSSAGKMTKSSGLAASVARTEASAEASVTRPSHRPEKNAARVASTLSYMTGRSSRFLARDTSATVTSVVEPVWTQMEAPRMPPISATPASRRTSTPGYS